MIALVAAAALLAQAQEGASPVRVEPTLAAEEALSALDRMLAYLLSVQTADGSFGYPFQDDMFDGGYAWETYYAWQMGAHALACEALARAPETAERRAALERGIAWLCSARLPMRGSDWDVDSTWPALVGFGVLVELARDARFAEGEWPARIRERALEFWSELERRQTLDGGWAYYDDPPFTERPTWATSFCTAMMLAPLVTARTELGWPIEARRIERATEMVRHCVLPNGAIAYDYNLVQNDFTGLSINAVKGSLGRIQVANVGLAAVGVKWVTAERVREGLAAFFEHHRFLDQARLRPIPHEGYYRNAGYFYAYGHYYAALAIELLPAEEREAWHARLRHHVVKTQGKDGSTADFLVARYLVISSTAYSISTLCLGLGPAAEARAR